MPTPVADSTRMSFDMLNTIPYSTSMRNYDMSYSEPDSDVSMASNSSIESIPQSPCTSTTITNGIINWWPEPQSVSQSTDVDIQCTIVQRIVSNAWLRYTDGELNAKNYFINFSDFSEKGYDYTSQHVLMFYSVDCL